MTVDRKLKLVSGVLIAFAVAVLWVSISSAPLARGIALFGWGGIVGYAGGWGGIVGYAGVTTPATIMLIGVMVVIAYLGIRGFLLLKKPEAEKARFLRFTDPYVKAWKDITSQRWMLSILGFGAALVILGDLAGSAMSMYRMRHTPVIVHSPGLGVARPLDIFFQYLPYNVWANMEDLLSRFFPRIALTGRWGSVALLGLAVLITLPYVYRRVKANADDPECGPQARFVKSLIPFAAALAVICFVGSPIAVYDQAYLTPGTTNILLGRAWLALELLIVMPMLVGGLAGSLKRNASGGSVTRESFLADAVRVFKPVAGVYFALYIVNCIGLVLRLSSPRTYAVQSLATTNPYLRFVSAAVQGISLILAGPFRPKYASHPIAVVTVCTILLLLAPYIAASGGRSAWDSLKESVRLWFTRRSGALYFTAFGVVLLTVMTLVVQFIQAIPPVGIPYLPTARIVVDLVRLSISTFVSVAVWEFYEQIKADPETAAEAGQ